MRQGYWYYDRGFNVLMITMRGYHGSEGDLRKEGELGMMLDVEAALDYIVNKRGIHRHRVVAHGYSLGGTYAATANFYYNIPAVLDHTFTSLAGIIQAHAPIGEMIPRAISMATYPIGLRYSLSGLERLPGPQEFITDGLNNLSKVKNSRADIFVIFGSEDRLMPQYFATELLTAKYESPEDRDRNSVLVPGDHGRAFFTEPEATKKLGDFLYDHGIY